MVRDAAEHDRHTEKILLVARFFVCMQTICRTSKLRYRSVRRRSRIAVRGPVALRQKITAQAVANLLRGNAIIFLFRRRNGPQHRWMRTFSAAASLDKNTAGAVAMEATARRRI